MNETSFSVHVLAHDILIGDFACEILGFFFKVAQSNTHYGFQILFTHITGSVRCIAVSVCVFLWRGRREDEGKGDSETLE